jgi:DNA-directed RNA polymerase subunit beta'
MNTNIPYGSELLVKSKTKFKKGDVICKWDPYNALIISEVKGTVVFENIEEGITYREEVDEQTGFTEKVITETKDKKKIQQLISLTQKRKNFTRVFYSSNSHISVNEGDKLDAGQILS